MEIIELSVGLPEFEDLQIFKGNIGFYPKVGDWINLGAPGLISIPFCAWVFGDNDLHIHNLGFSADGPSKVKFSKIDHGFVAQFTPYFQSYQQMFSSFVQGLSPTTITHEKIMSFPIPKSQGDYGRYWPFEETRSWVTSEKNRTPIRIANAFKSIVEEKTRPNGFDVTYGIKKFPLTAEKTAIIWSLISLLYDSNWVTLNSNLFKKIFSLCDPLLKPHVETALNYILTEIAFKRIDTLCLLAKSEFIDPNLKNIIKFMSLLKI